MKKNLSSRPFYKFHYCWFIFSREDSSILLHSPNPEPYVNQNIKGEIREWLEQEFKKHKSDKPAYIFKKNNKWIVASGLTTEKSIGRLTTIVEVFQHEKTD